MNKECLTRERAVLEETATIKEEEVKDKHSRKGVNSMCPSSKTRTHKKNKKK